MKRILFSAALVAALPVPYAFGANVDVSIGVNVGARPAVVVPAPPPPLPLPAPPVVVEEPPLFIEPPELGFHVAVGIPQDIFFIGGSYYLFRNNVWYVSPHFRGPWVVTHYHALPWKLRRYTFERIRYYRDAGYRQYRAGRDPYWKHHHFRPDKEWKEARQAKSERRWEREQWPHGRKGGADDSRHGGHDGPGHGGRHGGR